MPRPQVGPETTSEPREGAARVASEDIPSIPTSPAIDHTQAIHGHAELRECQHELQVSLCAEEGGPAAT